MTISRWTWLIPPSWLFAESLGVNRVFTLDSDFTVYRINGTQAFEVFPLG